MDHILDSVKRTVGLIVLLVLGAGVGWWAASTVYSDRLKVKEAQITDYQKRLGLVPRAQTAYSKLTEAELKQRTVELVRKLRVFNVKYLATRNSDMEAGRTRLGQDSAVALQNEFQTHLPEARALAEELAIRTKRINESGRGDVVAVVAAAVLGSGMLAGSDPVGAVASYLEQLANMVSSPAVGR